MKSISIKTSDRILIIAPHPDDECIGCGGILLSFPDQCDVWLLSDGRYGRDGEENEIIEIREKEFLSGLSMAGVKKYRMFRYMDQSLNCRLDSLINESISEYDIIFVPNGQDNHPDHVAAFQMVKNAIAYQNSSVKLYQYEVATPLVVVTDYLDISEIISKKIQLISLHKSQIKEFDYCEMARSLNYYRGIINKGRNRYYESYMSVDCHNGHCEELDLKQELNRSYSVMNRYENWLKELLIDRINHERIKITDSKEIVIYGCGMLGKAFAEALLSCSKDISIVFVDRDPDTEMRTGFRVIGLSELNKLKCFDTTIIISILRDYDVIKAILEDAGYKRLYSLLEVLL